MYFFLKTKKQQIIINTSQFVSLGDELSPSHLYCVCVCVCAFYGRTNRSQPHTFILFNSHVTYGRVLVTNGLTFASSKRKQIFRVFRTTPAGNIKYTAEAHVIRMLFLSRVHFKKKTKIIYLLHYVCCHLIFTRAIKKKKCRTKK